MDCAEYNGWKNVFTWLLYCHLSSYADVSAAVRDLVQHSVTLFEAADNLRLWVQDLLDQVVQPEQVSGIQLVCVDLLERAMGQVDWNALAQRFREF